MGGLLLHPRAAAVDVIESYLGQGEIVADDDTADIDVDTTDGEA